VILPGSRLELIRRSEKAERHAHHLDVREIGGMKRLIVVSEDLFDDYEKACKEVIARIIGGRLRGWKFEEEPDDPGSAPSGAIGNRRRS